MNILPEKIWTAGFHSHFVKTPVSSQLGFSNYSKEDFENYACRAYEMAQVQGLLIWGITDYNFDPVRWAKSIYPEKNVVECTKKWERFARQSEGGYSQKDKFLALSGFEYGKSVDFEDLSKEDKIKFKNYKNHNGYVDGFGDIVIYNAPFLAPAKKGNDLANDMELKEVYDYIGQYEGAFGIFAHPKGYPDGKGNNFNDLEFYEKAADAMVGFEILNGCMSYVKQLNFLAEYILALRRGWRVGAMYNQDNIFPNWGEVFCEGSPLGFTNVIADSNEQLTKENVYNKIRARKFYGTKDKNLAIGMKTDKGCGMGDVVAISQDDILLIQAKGAEVDKVKIYHGAVGDMDLMDIKIFPYKKDLIVSCLIKLPAEKVTDFYFVEFLDKEGDFIAHSSPIWVKRKK